jgi:hypothetical protein
MPRNIEEFTTLDEFLDKEGTREAFEAQAIKEVHAWNAKKAAETQHGQSWLASFNMATTATLGWVIEHLPWVGRRHDNGRDEHL